MKSKLAVAVIGSFLFSTAAVGHDHYVITGNGDRIVLAGGNGTHAGPGADNSICGGEPAWYGLEVAHHGPDASGEGISDGCYMVEGGLHPGDPDADRNPAIN